MTLKGKSMKLDLLVQINILGIITSLVLVFENLTSSRKARIPKLLSFLFLVCLSVLVLDTVSYFLVENGSFLGLRINVVIVGLIISADLIPPSIFFLILIKIFFIDSKRFRLYSHYLLIICGIVSIIVLTSPLTKFVYWFDSDFNYYRGFFFYVIFIIGFIISILYLFVVITKHQLLSKRETSLCVLVILVTILSSILQIIIPEVVSYWTSVSFSCVILFVYIKSTDKQIDKLTGLGSNVQHLKRIEDFKEINRPYFYLNIEFIDFNLFRSNKEIKKFIKLLLAIADQYNTWYEKTCYLSRLNINEIVMLFPSQIEHKLIKEYIEITRNKISNISKETRLKITSNYKTLI